MNRFYTGKVKDLYRVGQEVLLVTTDRMSIYDVSLPTPIPDKGALLTKLSSWWFERLAPVMPHHVISAIDVPDRFSGRALRCKPLKMIQVECIARGYLTGSALHEYQKHGTVWGMKLPKGLSDGSKLPEPIFTPTTKVSHAGHDEPITFKEFSNREGRETASLLRDMTLKIYACGTKYAEEKDLVIADTKVEFGWDNSGMLTLGDEVLTPDCTRFWPIGEQRPSFARHVCDKQVLRDWILATGWNRSAPAPAIPKKIVSAVRKRYITAYERITGEKWSTIASLNKKASVMFDSYETAGNFVPQLVA